MSKRVSAAAPPDLNAILVGDPLKHIQMGRRRRKVPQDDTGIPGIVGNQRLDIENAVVSLAVVDEFDSRRNCINGFAHLLGRERFAVRIQVSAQTDADLEFKTEASVLGHRQASAASEDSSAENRPADRLIDAAHLLHASGRQADLVTRTGIVADEGRHIGVLHAVGVHQAADFIEFVEVHAVAVLGNQLLRARALWLTQFLGSPRQP
jgi:hypothetical protein